MKFALLVLFFCLSGSLLHAQTKPIGATVSEGIPQSVVERLEMTLASDAMLGRGLPVGADKAAQFIQAEFERIGLSPLPGLTSFEQKFTAFELRTSALYVLLNNAPLTRDKLAMVSGVSQLNWADDDSGVRMMVVGAEANFMKVVQPLLEPTENVVAFIDPAHAEQFKKIRDYLSRSSIRATKPAFSTVLVLAPIGNGTVRYRVAANTSVRPMELRNVVGMLPGKDAARANQQVIFSAHYDHLGKLPTVAGDSIANGADDDASGTTAVIALADYFKKRADNARPLIFSAFTAEEIGGLGSQYFASQLKPENVVAMFNIEMIGKPAKFGPNTAFITGFDKSDLGTLLQQGIQGSAFRFEPDPYPEQQLFYRSDNATLARLGVPAHSISTDQIPTDKFYHTLKDEVETLDLRNMTVVINAIARATGPIVAGKATPRRIAQETAKSVR